MAFTMMEEATNLDYRNVESPYLPYYPNYNDARTVSKTKAEIVEIPTQSVKKILLISLICIEIKLEIFTKNKKIENIKE